MCRKEAGRDLQSATRHVSVGATHHLPERCLIGGQTSRGCLSDLDASTAEPGSTGGERRAGVCWENGVGKEGEYCSPSIDRFIHQYISRSPSPPSASHAPPPCLVSCPATSTPLLLLLLLFYTSPSLPPTEQRA